MASSSSNRSPLVFITAGVFVILLSFCAGIAGSVVGSHFLSNRLLQQYSATGIISDSGTSATVAVAEMASPSVVSIVISKEISGSNPLLRDPYFRYFEVPQSSPGASKLQQVGAGSGFIISADGLVLTNKHVVDDTTATYTVILNDNTEIDAKVIARDTILDIAVLKIETDRVLKPLVLGDSDAIKIGQTAIAIGNSLGEFSNTVSAGIISGLGRSIVASDSVGLKSEQLRDVIQTDASINPGNSGGPLLDITGKVIGVNVAVAQDAQSIGFAIPINSVKPVINSISEFGRIVRPYLGVRYLSVTPDMATESNLKVTYGAYITTNSTESAVIEGGPAAKAGIKDKDVIIQINDQKLDEDHDLQTEIQKYKVGDKIKVLIIRGEQELELTATLEERPAE